MPEQRQLEADDDHREATDESRPAGPADPDGGEPGEAGSNREPAEANRRAERDRQSGSDERESCDGRACGRDHGLACIGGKGTRAPGNHECCHRVDERDRSDGEPDDVRSTTSKGRHERDCGTGRKRSIRAGHRFVVWSASMPSFTRIHTVSIAN
jgi:hypothetical protein